MVIGFIGSGNIGGTVARLAVNAGHSVVVSNSRGPETLAELVAELGPNARAGTAEEAGRAGEIVVVSVPFGVHTKVPVEPLAGKIVIDTNNYYHERDGRFPDIDEGRNTDSGALADHLGTARVVKAFNTIYYVDLGEHGLPAGDPARRALPIAGDDPDAKRVVAELLDEFGFDTVDAGALAEGWRFQRDKPAYGPRLTASELREALTKA
ncbi:NADPH-dependent F420 reductase [Acrocarpospora sp. B8E8]|uniref:NADPH-dependent F420 reductase n=1 Tax=Acrocarpospora sp. B8E8 TaxID=3153572 RepID=UPI00325E234E